MTLTSKKCVINNYIPHETPKFGGSQYKKKMHYNKWLVHYKDNLIEMFYIFYRNISNRYEENKFDNTLFYSDKYHDLIYDNKIFINLTFVNFCKMIYNSSSKYIEDLKI